MSDLPASLSTVEMARLLGLSTDRVAKLGSSGVLPKAGRGRYPLADGVQAYIRFIKENPEGRPRVSGNLEAEKVRLTAAQADLAEQKAAAGRGELLDADLVRRRWVDTAARLRAALLAVPSRVASRLGMDRAAAAELDAELRAALDEIATAGEQQAEPAIEELLS